MNFDDLKPEYEKLWASIELKTSMAKECNWGAAKVLAGRTRYEAVSEQTGVPWYVIGLMHLMEAGCEFACHLHNGDPLTAKTVNKPVGRPKAWKAPYDWNVSAVDAIQIDGLHKVTDWSLARIAYCFETFNGWGYRKYHPEVCNPYLWGGTAHYVKGKYVEEKERPGVPVWKPNLVSKQVGAMAVLHRLCGMVPEVGAVLNPPKPALRLVASEPPVTTTPESFPKADPPSPVRETVGRSRTLQAALFVILGWVIILVEWVGKIVDFVVAVGLDAVVQMTKLEALAKLAPPGAKWVGGTIGLLSVTSIAAFRLQDAWKGRKR